MNPSVLFSDQLGRNRVLHGFTTRALGDDWDRIAQEKGFSAVRGLPLVLLKQVHGTDVLVVDREAQKLPQREERKFDASITNRSDLVLGVRTADCVPVLMVSEKPRAIAAVHAGWKGTLANILKSAVEALGSNYGCKPDKLMVAMGPSIRSCCYEVGPEVYEPFLRRFGSGAALKKGDRLVVDLVVANRISCEELGVPADHIGIIDCCTFCQSELFYSYRREKVQSGRQMAFISLARP